MRRESERTFVLRFKKKWWSKKIIPVKNEARKAEEENGNTVRAGRGKDVRSLREGRSEMRKYKRRHCLGYSKKKWVSKNGVPRRKSPQGWRKKKRN